MNTLQIYQSIINHVTATNNLAVRLMQDKITKKDAMAEYKELLDKAQGAVE